MPLTANFIADFSSFIKAAADATTTTEQLVAAAGKVGATLDQGVAQASASLQTVGSKIADFGKNAWSVLSSTQMREFASSVVDFSTRWVGEFAKAESATSRLTQSLKDVGLATPEITKQYDEMARQLQKVSTFSHVAITDAQAVFTTIGKVGPENMQATLEAAMNLAAFMKTDIVDAAKLMEKAAASDGAAVGRLKTALGDAYHKGMDFNEIVEAIAKKFSGQFAADLDTTTGSLKNFQNQMEDANEELGKMQAKTLRGLLDSFHQLPESMQNFLLKSYELLHGLEPVMGALGAVAQVASALFPEALAAAGAAVLEFVGVLVGWPAAIVAGVGIAAVAIYKNWDAIVAYLKGVTERVKQYMMVDQPAAFNSTVEAVSKWFYSMKFFLLDEFTKIIDKVVEQIPRITAAIKLMAELTVLRSYVPDMVNGIGSQFSRLQTIMVDPALNAIDTVVRAFDQIQLPNMFSSMTMPNFDQFHLPLMFSATSGLTATQPGVQISLNMTGMLGTDDPQTRQIMSDLVSNAVMQGMRGGRLLGTA